MNLREASGSLRHLAFRFVRAMASTLPGGRIAAFGAGKRMIGSILVVNLDRQPRRWRRVLRELGCFRTSEGVPLTSIVRRLTAVDARDGRAVAATADVDSKYCMGDQLYVQPDARLAECFGVDEPITMTRQEVAIARSHIEAWKAIANGSHDNVLVLEDDVWFKRGAAAAIDRGWSAALRRCDSGSGPHLVYLSYADAGAERVDVCDALFRPVRGLWFLSGYVLSREGAATLLRAMPVNGPVDLWMNYRFKELGALALTSPAILQRQDGTSDNSYSILPYLARAGIVDASSGPRPPDRSRVGPVMAWTSGGERESLAMALSMLGLRVRAFDADDRAIGAQDLRTLFEVFDALVDAPLASGALSAVIAMTDSKFLLDAKAMRRAEFEPDRLPSSRTVILSEAGRDARSWEPLCALFGLAEPVQTFPLGAPRGFRLFRADRPDAASRSGGTLPRKAWLLDDSPWVLPPLSGWQPTLPTARNASPARKLLVQSSRTVEAPAFRQLVETFPGNLSSFAKEGLVHDEDGAHLVIIKAESGSRPYRSGAFASVRSFEFGRFEAEIRAAAGSGLITGFFLHRDAPRQEIDVELAGNTPRHMLVNVYFNPGDEGAAMGFGYRGSPCRIDLGFDTTLDFHVYAIDWRPGRITWSVDGRIVHERVGWDPTPVPHLPMRLNANLWTPRSERLAGRIDDRALPATATFRNVSVWE